MKIYVDIDDTICYYDTVITIGTGKNFNIFIRQSF